MTLLRESFKTTRRPLIIFFFIHKSKTTYFFGRIRGCEKRILFWKKLLKKPKQNEREIFLLIDFFLPIVAYCGKSV